MEEKFASKTTYAKPSKPTVQSKMPVEKTVAKAKFTDPKPTSSSGVNISLGGPDSLDNDFMEF
jgi:hypothetical protein